MKDGYPLIEDHGLIGDLQTSALVSTEGSIDWFCAPRFDSPSVFGALLDKDKGGYCRIRPIADEFTTKQLYFPDTAALVTRYLTEEGVGEVIDFMPVTSSRAGGTPPDRADAAMHPGADDVRRRNRATLRLRPRTARDEVSEGGRLPRGGHHDGGQHRSGTGGRESGPRRRG